MSSIKRPTLEECGIHNPEDLMDWLIENQKDLLEEGIEVIISENPENSSNPIIKLNRVEKK